MELKGPTRRAGVPKEEFGVGNSGVICDVFPVRQGWPLAEAARWGRS